RMKELNYSQKELANMLEMTAPRLCEILSGKKFPTYQQARRIANKLNIDPGIVLSL
ncbi:MAG: helix-turn-helix transcriptional regulator, partial [Bacteroidales bacterium]|nr:helix-turn-helix transcriptional regulator [Bacteroidales bacterium]